MTNLKTFYSSLPEPFQSEMLARIRHHWPLNARPSQIPRTGFGAERYQVIVGGRWSGKTRAGAEWVRELARTPNLRLLLVARTAADVRKTLIEGESGILACSPVSERPLYRPSARRLDWSNGTTAFVTSADEPDSIRGWNVHFTWFDEPNKLPAFDNADLSTRLGDDPQILVTGTSIGDKFSIWEEFRNARDNHNKFRGSGIAFYHNPTPDNASNLPVKGVDRLFEQYFGTQLSDRELFGVL